MLLVICTPNTFSAAVTHNQHGRTFEAYAVIG
jgi:hypothetical protein